MPLQPPSDDLTAAYPIVVLQDRYGGVCSGGVWIALVNADEQVEGMSRASWLLQFGPGGEDTEAMTFWEAPPDWIVTGASPDDAVRNLLRAIR